MASRRAVNFKALHHRTSRHSIIGLQDACCPTSAFPIAVPDFPVTETLHRCSLQIPSSLLVSCSSINLLMDDAGNEIRNVGEEAPFSAPILKGKRALFPPRGNASTRSSDTESSLQGEHDGKQPALWGDADCRS